MKLNDFVADRSAIFLYVHPRLATSHPFNSPEIACIKVRKRDSSHSKLGSLLASIQNSCSKSASFTCVPNSKKNKHYCLFAIEK